MSSTLMDVRSLEVQTVLNNGKPLSEHTIKLRED